jgi:two-component system, NtrC family, response regulator PilR
MQRLLIVDDERSMRELLELVFKRDGYAVETAANGREAFDKIRNKAFDLVISDVRMPDMNGIELLEQVRVASPETLVIMLTAFATIDTARRAFKLGAEDVIIKDSGFDVEELKILVRKAIEKTQLRQRVKLLEQELTRRSSLDNIIGKSPRMQTVYRMIETVAQTHSTVLITGEPGTGKELVARAIHNLSPRRTAPLVSINCGAFTETLLESELFGYMKGAFTGAAANKKGLFEAADGGTIFLDEIGEMSSTMQVKLLRVLQERLIRRVGGIEELPVDVRVICATNRDLEEEVKRGSFREDLYYRVSVIPIELPPLRVRTEDIPDLVDHFTAKFANDSDRPKLKVDPEAMRYLEAYRWPGNVRELENTIERAVAFESTDTIQPERLPQKILNYSPAEVTEAMRFPESGFDLSTYLAELEKSYLIEALRRTRGNQTRSAELLRMSVRSFRHLLDKYGIRELTGPLRER